MSAYVYLMKIPSGVYKIGVAKDVDKRVKQLQTGSTEEISIIDKFLSDYPYKIESVLHRRHYNDNVSGEWFYLNDDQINSFKSDCNKLETNFKILEQYNNPYIKF